MWKEGEFECKEVYPIMDNSYFRLLFSKSDINKTYPILYKNGKFETVNTEYLVSRYEYLTKGFSGDVLILGLGLGVCDLVIDSPTYIEKYIEVINNVKVKGRVIHGDARILNLNEKFDFILNDIIGYDRGCDFSRFLKPYGKLVKFSLI